MRNGDRRRTMAPASVLLLVLALSGARGYLETWGLHGGRPTQPTCVDIPRNMSLCHGIGYNKMRLPNLLDHDTMAEVSQQASSWVALNNIRCHPDIQLFLCSLFSPVCLDRPIYPCRSLCEKVKQGCEGRMKKYGFPWPEMFNCSKFPQDNDMCITPQSSAEDRCLVCNPVDTYENILDNFCRADFAVKTKIRRAKKTVLKCKKAKVLKGGSEISKQLVHPVLHLEPSDSCCEEKTRNSREVYLIMGHCRGDAKLVPTFIMPWGKNSKPFRKAVRMFKKLNCSDPKLVSHSVIGDAFGGGGGGGGGSSTSSNGSSSGNAGGITNTGANANATGRRKRGRAKGRHKKTSIPTPATPP
ncbi:secreted frizzled-related protein 5-like [Periplaneta americana]|uniref:secreted frizzled-related protein 5-like n=1 Tax=Periplaneta americana TaxID=6978 RepID=UPI0037E7E0E2